MHLRKPKNHTIVDMYRAWCAAQLTDKNYFSEHDVQVRWKNIRVIYQKSDTWTQVQREVLNGEFNGTNRVFQTSHKYWVPGTLRVYKNGVLQSAEPGNPDRDYYSIPGKHMIMMLEPPKATDIITADYQYYNHTMIMSYTMFRLIVETYNKYAAEALILGNRFDLGGNLGYLFPARIERSFHVSKVDVVSTLNIRRQDPTHPAIYYTSPDYCMVKWQKKYRTRNETVYSFITAKTTFRREFSESNKKNPVLKTNYKFYPVQRQQSA